MREEERLLSLQGPTFWSDHSSLCVSKVNGPSSLRPDVYYRFAPDFDTHIARLREVFDRLRAANLKLHPSNNVVFFSERLISWVIHCRKQALKSRTRKSRQFVIGHGPVMSTRFASGWGPLATIATLSPVLRLLPLLCMRYSERMPRFTGELPRKMLSIG